MDSIIFDKEFESFSIAKTRNLIETRRFSGKEPDYIFYQIEGDSVAILSSKSVLQNDLVQNQYS